MRPSLRTIAILAVTAVTALTAVTAVTLAPLPALAEHPTLPCSWPMYGRDTGRSFAQDADCSLINRDTVATLRPKWIRPVGDSVTASPAVKDGILYVGSWDGRFYALDADDGRILWTFQIDDDHRVAFGRIVSSAAIDTIDIPGAGPVQAVIFGGGATLYALRHSATGPELLAKVDVDPRTPELRAQQADDPPQVEIESSPLVARIAGEDRIFVGMDVHNTAGVGRTGMLSFGLRTCDGICETPLRFELLYKFDPETGTVRHSLTEGFGDGFGCGGVWSSPTLAGSAIVFGTSNCKDPQASLDADEVGREAIFAIDAATGAELWRFQPRDGNVVDDDFGATPNALPGGAVGAGGKDGFYYVHDATTGTERYRAHPAQSGRVSQQFAIGGILGSTAMGTVSHPFLDVVARTLVFATSAFPTPLAQPLDSPNRAIDESLAQDPARVLSVHAIDAATGQIVWRSALSAPSYGAPSLAGGVLFVPVTFGSRLQAFDAFDGTPLWAMPTIGAPSSTPVVVGDSLYVGTGTRETDAEFKAFGDDLQQVFAGAIGSHPLSPLSTISAYSIGQEEQ